MWGARQVHRDPRPTTTSDTEPRPRRHVLGRGFFPEDLSDSRRGRRCWRRWTTAAHRAGAREGSDARASHAKPVRRASERTCASVCATRGGDEVEVPSTTAVARWAGRTRFAAPSAVRCAPPSSTPPSARRTRLRRALAPRRVPRSIRTGTTAADGPRCARARARGPLSRRRVFAAYRAGRWILRRDGGGRPGVHPGRESARRVSRPRAVPQTARRPARAPRGGRAPWPRRLERPAGSRGGGVRRERRRRPPHEARRGFRPRRRSRGVRQGRTTRPSSSRRHHRRRRLTPPTRAVDPRIGVRAASATRRRIVARTVLRTFSARV